MPARVHPCRNTVFDPFLNDLQIGLTPNPDLPCNVHVKFDALLRHVTERLGAQYLATGHYAQIDRRDDGGTQLLRGADEGKDQSYFLAAVPPGVWGRVLFPLGSWEKHAVRDRARALGLESIAAKRSSARPRPRPRRPQIGQSLWAPLSGI